MKVEHSTRLQDVRSDLQEVQDRIQRIEDDLRSMAEDPHLTNGNGNGNGSHALDLEQINDSLAELGEQHSQEGILAAYLKQTEPFFDRGVLFLRKDSRYVAWKSVGFDSDSLSEVVLESADSAVVQAADQRAVLNEDEDLADKFPWLDEATLPANSVCVPLVFDDSTPVVLYADSKGDRSVDSGSLELLTQLTVLVLKNHYLSYLSLQPTSIGEVQVSDLPSPDSTTTPAVESAEVALGTPTESEKHESAGISTDAFSSVASGSEAALEDEDTSYDVESADESRAEDDSWKDVEALSQDKTWDTPASDEEERAMEAADDAIEEAEQAAHEALEHAGTSLELGASSLEDSTEEDASDDAVAAAGDNDDSPESGDASEENQDVEEALETSADETTSSTWLDDRLQSTGDTTPVALEDEPAADKQVFAGVTAPSRDSDEEAPHSEARRFARLLVSEIKLYNVDSIEQGRKEKDLYERLQRDIDRSRDMYEKRVHPSVRRETDYFHEEVLRILAVGDQAALGADYPGPQIEDS